MPHYIWYAFMRHSFGIPCTSLISFYTGKFVRAWPIREMPGSTVTPIQAVWAAAKRANFDHNLLSLSRVRSFKAKVSSCVA